MRIVAIDAYGQRPTVREVAVPDIGSGELLVRVRAAGVNPIDALIARGRWLAVPVVFPLTLGLDFAGVVERYGDRVKRFRTGDRVYGRVGSSPLQHGSFADHVVVSEDGTISVLPEQLDFIQAAALPSPAMTALSSIDAAGVNSASRVLVVGAAGGVGGYAVQFASNRGAHVIATAQAQDAEYVRRLGAKATVDYTRGDLADAVRSDFFDGIDVLLDFASDAPALNALSRLIRPGGALVSTRSVADLESLVRESVRGTSLAAKPTPQLLRRITRAVNEGEIEPADVRTFPLADAAAALDEIEGGHVRGRLVLLMDEK